MICPECATESADQKCAQCKVLTKYPGRLFHDFRRTGVRNMIRSGVPQNVAMKIRGHKTASMFRRYDICDEDDLREAMTSVARYHESQAKASKVKVVNFENPDI